ncbi:hypothetical protein [Desulfobulbus sp.]|uniref:hypothetical protein n=1 Tax=Desulfobulbus sp. TaxID=895 RepID=UPI0027BA5714|nr:hypothetical protein [Desulfobulbus sp.]
MKNICLVAVLFIPLLASGCAQKITGPGPIDTSVMRKVEEQCAAYFLGIGPFGDSSLKQKPDTIQYTVHNYFIYSTFCTEGYNK